MALAIVCFQFSATASATPSTRARANGPILATPWPAFFPAMALAIVFISFQFLGDGLRDALDPR